MTFSVRTLESRDMAAAARLGHQVHTAPQFLTVVVLDKFDRLKGIATIDRKPQVFDICDFVCREPEPARHLINSLVSVLKHGAVERILVTVDEINLNALRLFADAGFVALFARRRPDDCDAIRMQYRLQQNAEAST